MANNTWTQSKIGEWGEKTFGCPKNPFALAARADVEFDEFIQEIYSYGGDFNPYLKDEIDIDRDKTLEEMADVVIIFKQLAYYLGEDLEDIIAKKMIKNVHRKWTITEDGVGRHVDS